MDHSRFYAEVSEVRARTRALEQKAELHRLLREAEVCPWWRSSLAAQLRSVAERLEPQPQPIPPIDNVRRTW